MSVFDKHTNKIAIEILKNEYADYDKNYWHYSSEYRMLCEAQRIVIAQANGAEQSTEQALHKQSVINWVAIESNEHPEPVTDVLVRFKNGAVACRFFDGDGRFYNLPNDIDITDNVVAWANLPK